MFCVVCWQTLLRHSECASARTNRDNVVVEMKRALDLIEMVVTDTSVPQAPSTSVSDVSKEQQQDRSTTATTTTTSLTVNTGDSGISLSQLQTTALTAIKDFEV